jgi:hypothetical protein
MEGSERCEACGRRTPELAYSCAAGAVVCERCHCDSAPPASPEAVAYRYRPRRQAPRKPSEYAQLVERAWAALEQAGPHVFSMADGTGRLIGWCPVCREGSVLVQVLNDPPRARTAGCSAGCPSRRVLTAL